MTEFTSKLPRDLSIEKSRRMSRGEKQKQEQTKQRVYLAQPASHCGYKFKEARRSINAVRAPPSQGGLGTSRPPGPRLSFHPSLPPPLSFSFPAPHPFPPLALPSDNPHQRGNAKDLFRAGPGSSPFEVSGVLALHGGGGSVVGRMGVSESLGRLLSGTRPKYPHSRGGDSPEACKAGRRRRCGYHGEAAGSSHSSWAPETLEQPRPAQVYARRMRSRDSCSMRRLSCRPWLLRLI